MLNFLIVLAGFAIASYTDIKTHEVPAFLTHSMIVIGLIFHAVESFLTASIQPFLLSAFMGICCFLFAYSLYRIGVWAGGDVKLFTALGTLVPVYGKIMFFPFLALGASLIAIFPFLVLYLLYFLLVDPKLRKKTSSIVAKNFRRAVFSPFYLIAAYQITILLQVDYLFTFLIVFLFYFMKVYGVPFVAFFTIMAMLSGIDQFAMNFAYIFILSMVFFTSVASFKVARKYLLRKKVKVSKLKEGDISAVDVVLVRKKPKIIEPKFLDFFTVRKNLIIDSRKACGLEKKEIQKLKRLKIKQLEIKLSLPFVPIFTIGILILYVLEMLI